MSKRKSKRRSAHTIAREHNRKPEIKINFRQALSDAFGTSFSAWLLSSGIAFTIFLIGDKNHDLWLFLKVDALALPILLCWKFLFNCGAQKSDIIEVIDFILNDTYDETHRAAFELMHGLIVAALILAMYIRLSGA